MKITKTQLRKIIKEELVKEEQSYELELAIQLLVDGEDALNRFFDKNAGEDNALNALLGDAADDLRKVIEAIADFKNRGLNRRQN